MSQLLSLRRPTTASEAAQLIPVPAASLPERSFPEFERLLLNQKLPYYGHFTQPLTFARATLGQCLWEYSERFPFDLADPQRRVTGREYDPLHDKHLKNYWTNHIRKLLRYHGLITEDDRVICSLKEFNVFRNFLFQEFREQWIRLLDEKILAHRAEKQCKFIENRLKNMKDYEGVLASKQEKVEHLFHAMMDKWQKSIARTDERMNQFLRDRNELKQQTLQESHLRYIVNRQKNEDLRAQIKSNSLKLKRRLHLRDRRVAGAIRSAKQRNEEMLKFLKSMIVEFYQTHKAWRQTEDQELITVFRKDMAERVRERQKRYHNMHVKLEQDLVHRKTKNLSSKYDKRSKPALINALLANWKRTVEFRDPDSAHSVTKQSVERAVNVAYAIHTTISPAVSSTMIIDTASQLLFDQLGQPVDPMPTDRQTVSYVRTRLLEAVNEIVSHAIEKGCTLITQIATRYQERLENPYPSSRRPSIDGPWNAGREMDECSNCRAATGRVSIGGIHVVDEYETDQGMLKKTKLRPPTPITSVSSLVERTMMDTAEDGPSRDPLALHTDLAQNITDWILSKSYPLVHLMVSQRRRLELNLAKYRMILGQYVDQRVLVSIDRNLLEISVRKAPVSDETLDRLLHESALCLLQFPDNEYRYASLMLKTIRLATAKATRAINEIINDA